MIDFELLAKELGPDTPTASSQTPTAIQEPDADYADNHYSEGFETVKELPPILDAAEFVAVEYPQPSELVKGLVHQGTKVVIGGGSKSFKTWVQLDLAISIAYGLTWMGFETEAGKVLFVNMEIQKKFFQGRLLKICETRGIQQVSKRLDVWNLRGHTASYRIVIPQIIKRIKEAGYSVIFLDPIYKLYGNTDENSASEVAQLLNEQERQLSNRSLPPTLKANQERPRKPRDVAPEPE